MTVLFQPPLFGNRFTLTSTTPTVAESSIINNTMLVQIAILGWIFLGESLTWWELLGLGLATAGIMIVQLVKSDPSSPNQKGA